MVNLSINLATSPTDIALVRALFMEYLGVLKTDFNNKTGCASGLESLNNFPEGYQALFLAKLGGEAVAACGLKHINAEDCELGKLYSRPSGRGHGLGRKLTQAAIQYTSKRGCKRLVLSTEPAMKHAGKIYESIGFEDIENYACGGTGCSRFMAYSL